MSTPGTPNLDGPTKTSSTELPPTATFAADPPIVPLTRIPPLRIGAYRILETIGVGGMGVVYLAEDDHLRRRVAIKVLHPEEASNPLRKERFLREARATAALEHDHIVRVYHADEIDGSLYLVMELLKGESLRERLTREPKMSVVEAIRIGSEVADGLAYAHAHGLIHRDISPANVWIEPSGRAKILDFGLVHILDQASPLTRPGSLMGTPGYMSPEQATGETVTSASDLFSLGCLLYQMAAGSPAFPGATARERVAALLAAKPKSVRQFVTNLPLPLLDLIEQLLIKEPASRPASAEKVSQDLRAIDPTVLAASDEESNNDEPELQFNLNPALARKPATDRTRRGLIIGGAAIILIAVAGIALTKFADKPNSPIVAKEDNPKPSDDKRGQVKRPPFSDERRENNNERVEAKGLPLSDEWVEKVSRMSPQEQYAEVSAELRRRNPGIKDGDIRTYESMDRGVISFSISSTEVEDLTPLRAFPELKNVVCNVNDGTPRNGKLSSLEALRGMKLAMLDVKNTRVKDLSPLEGMNLNFLDIGGTSVTDLAPLAKLDQRQGLGLQLKGCQIKSLEPLRDLRILRIEFDTSEDLSAEPLRHMKGLVEINGMIPSKFFAKKPAQKNE